MGSSRPGTMREETENLVLSKRKASAGIICYDASQDKSNIQNTLSTSGTSLDMT